MSRNLIVLFITIFSGSGLIASAAGALPPTIRAGCEAYAKIAVAQHKQNLAQKCGLSGKGWSTSFNGHYHWCRQGSNFNRATSENGKRAAALQACKQGGDTVRAACGAYAKMAMKQVAANRSMRCGYSGKGWQNSYNAHFGWCTYGKNHTRAVSQNANRGKQIAQCGVRMAKCQAFSLQAQHRQQQNKKLGCGFGGPRWTTNVKGHYDWCMDHPGRTAHETAARKKQLVNCVKK